jgi:hypothetical protein
VTGGGSVSVGSAAINPLSSSYLPSIDTNCGDYPSNVWVTGPLYKLRRDSGIAGSCPGTDGNKWGTFYGTQNEFVDFQVHFHDAGSGTSKYSVIVSNFVQGYPASYTISASTASVPFSIVVYREAYMNVTTESGTASTYYGTTGYFPDILIPAVDPYYDQTTNAFPFSIVAGENQSVWIDIHIPPAAPSGYYLGTVTLKTGNITIATLPIIIGVWQWPNASYMPSTASLPTSTGSGYADLCSQFYRGYFSCSNYPGSSGSDDNGVSLTQQQLSVLFLDHRWSETDTYPPVSARFSAWEGFWKPFFNGTGPSVPSLMLPGARFTSGTYSAPGPGATSVANPAAQNWLTEFSDNGWYSATAPTFYPVDEPQSICSNWTNFLNAASVAHGDTPRGQMLVTSDIADATTCGALSSIDIMATLITQMDPIGGSLQRSSYDSWLSRAATNLLWSYQSCSNSGTCSNGTTGGSSYSYPNLDIDGLPVANRASEWLTFYHQQSGELYYATTYCWENPSPQPCGYPTTDDGDPWNTVYAFGGNGDGTLVYPSTSNGTNHVTTSGGSALSTPIALPSIRLKNMRDGMQDYEYLMVLANNGLASLVQTEITSWIANSYTFNVNPTSAAGSSTSDLMDARQALGNAMQQLTYAEK